MSTSFPPSQLAYLPNLSTPIRSSSARLSENISLTYTPPPPPPQCRVLLYCHTPLGPRLSTHSSSSLDIPPTCPTATHPSLSQSSYQCKPSCNPHEDKHLKPDSRHDIHIWCVCVELVFEDEPYTSADTSAEECHEAGAESEEADWDTREATVDGERAEEDEDEGCEGTGEEEYEHSVGGGADYVEVVRYGGGEGDYYAKHVSHRERENDRSLWKGIRTRFSIHEFVNEDLNRIKPVH
jgi:hypothetical protein